MTTARTAIDLASRLLNGAVLDSIQIYSVIVILNFHPPEPMDDGPNGPSVAVSGDLNVGKRFENAESMDFFDRRAEQIGKLFRLIGRPVESVSIAVDGALSLTLGGALVTMSADDESLEEVWSVSFGSKQVALTDSGQFTVVGA